MQGAKTLCGCYTMCARMLRGSCAMWLLSALSSIGLVGSSEDGGEPKHESIISMMLFNNFLLLFIAAIISCAKLLRHLEAIRLDVDEFLDLVIRESVPLFCMDETKSTETPF